MQMIRNFSNNVTDSDEIKYLKKKNEKTGKQQDFPAKAFESINHSVLISNSFAINFASFSLVLVRVEGKVE